MARCRWVEDPEIGRLHLPGCMGAAVYGPRGCTCNPRGKKPLQQQIDELREEVRDLRAKLTPGERHE